MTATVSERTLDVPVQVRFTATGMPLAVRYDGRVWAVAAEPVHWFSRDTCRTAPVGVGNVVDVEHWRLQVRLGASASALRTFELRRDPLSEQWVLASITDN